MWWTWFKRKMTVVASGGEADINERALSAWNSSFVKCPFSCCAPKMLQQHAHPLHIRVHSLMQNDFSDILIAGTSGLRRKLFQNKTGKMSLWVKVGQQFKNSRLHCISVVSWYFFQMISLCYPVFMALFKGIRVNHILLQSSYPICSCQSLPCARYQMG